MILASAQTNSFRFDIQKNLDEHYAKIELAASNGADLILFPELSITGYKTEKVKELIFNENDLRLNGLRELSVKYKIIVIAGAPIQINNDLYIGAFIIKPDASLSIYTKQFLHTTEDKIYQSSFDYNPIIAIENERLSLAICADINNPTHPENAKKNDVSIYLASIFFEPHEMLRAYNILSSYAAKHSMHVLMSNYTGKSWEVEAGGKSGFWDRDGRLIANMNEPDSGILLVEKVNGKWSRKALSNIQKV
ncbi:carbon-nitrogen hydrolase family protein [Peijinzhouia sedimentorum]